MQKEKNEVLVDRWSYSKLSVFEECARKFLYQHVKKLPMKEKNWAKDRGIIAHKNAENFLKGFVKTVPSEFAAYQTELKAIKKLKAHAELDTSYTKSWVPCKWNDWDNVWCISAQDAVVSSGDEAISIDYKTGKIYDTHVDQSDSYALALFVCMPKIKYVRTEFWYLDLPNEDPGIHEYERSTHYALLKNEFARRAKKIMTEKSWKCSPSWKCSRCDFNKQNGGPCEH